MAVAPESSEAHYLLARAYRFLGRMPEAAKESCKRAESLPRVDPRMLGGMGPSR